MSRLSPPQSAPPHAAPRRRLAARHGRHLLCCGVAGAGRVAGQSAAVVRTAFRDDLVLRVCVEDFLVSGSGGCRDWITDLERKRRASSLPIPIPIPIPRPTRPTHATTRLVTRGLAVDCRGRPGLTSRPAASSQRQHGGQHEGLRRDAVRVSFCSIALVWI